MFKNFKISPDERKLFAKSDSNDLDKNNLKGKIKTIIAVEIKEQQNNPMQFMPSAQKPLFEISDFNEKGEMVTYREVYQGNILFMKKEYVYENNNLTKELIYDENENLIETVSFKHNSKNLMTEEFRKDYDIKLNAIYDENNQLQKVTDKSELQGYGEKIYNIKRNPNNLENITEISLFQNDELSQVSKYKYDERGNVIEVEHISANNEPISAELIDYDKNDNIIKLSSKNKRRTTEYSYEYQYDSFGNWIKFKFYINGDFSQETKREIHYY